MFNVGEMEIVWSTIASFIFVLFIFFCLLFHFFFFLVFHFPFTIPFIPYAVSNHEWWENENKEKENKETTNKKINRLRLIEINYVSKISHGIRVFTSRYLVVTKRR